MAILAAVCVLAVRLCEDYLVMPKVLEINERRCVVRIALNWRTRNHLRSMYFGALCIGADVAGGLIAFHLSSKQNAKVSFVFKDMKAEFLKRAEDDVHFSCEDGATIRSFSTSRTGIIGPVPIRSATRPMSRTPARDGDRIGQRRR